MTNSIVLWRPQVDSVYQMDCFDLMRAMPPQSVDLVLTDAPYNITAAKWEMELDLPAWWAGVKRILKPRGACVMTASQPFTSRLVCSNLEMFKCEWIWDKVTPTGFLNAKQAPLKSHESVLVFAPGIATYNPQKFKKPYKGARSGIGFTKRGKPIKAGIYGQLVNVSGYRDSFSYPKTVIKFPTGNGWDKRQYEHPTQKPVALFSYLIRTYTQPGALVFDPFVGSGTTAVAARNEGRHFIVGDSDPHYCNVARERLRAPYERHYIERDNDVTTLPVAEGYARHLFAVEAS